MAITSASTQAEIVGQYLDNVSYDHAGSSASAKLFIAACRALLVMHPSNWADGKSAITFNPSLWQQQLTEAQVWLNANTSTAGQGSVRHMSFGGDFR